MTYFLTITDADSFDLPTYQERFPTRDAARAAWNVLAAATEEGVTRTITETAPDAWTIEAVEDGVTYTDEARITVADDEDDEPAEQIIVTVETAPTVEVQADVNTWTFVGHWESGEIVVEYVLPGTQQDDREDTGYWDEGLFAAAGTGATEGDALAAVRAEYENAPY